MTTPLERTVTVSKRAGAIGDAAKRRGIPLWILWGVFGLETAFGQNIKTSSAGAVGAFQFMPDTARWQGGRYPLTNTPTDAQFAIQADEAARYLSTLYREHGNNWDAALHAYSGGGYGLSQVRAKARERVNVGSGVPGYDETKNAVGDAVHGALGWTDTLGKLLTFLMRPSTWLRVLELIGGLVLGFFALKQLAASAQGARA